MNRTHTMVGVVVGIAWHLVSKRPKSGRAPARITPAKDLVLLEDKV